MTELPKPFQFELVARGSAFGLRIVVGRTKFDVTCASLFRTEVDKVWRPEIEHVLLDFTKVEFIDSSGVGALVSLQKRLDPEVSPIEILNPSAAVTTVIELLRLHRVFKLSYTTPPEARPASRPR